MGQYRYEACLSGRYLTSAVFELRAAADIVGKKEGTVFYKQGTGETLTTSADGAVNSKAAAAGQLLLAGSFRSGRLFAG